MAQEKQHKKLDGVKIGAIIILILSALVFVFFGFGADVYSSLLNSNSKLPVFGKYEGRKIEYKPGTDYFVRVSELAQRFQNAGYTMDTQTQYYVFHEAYIQTIQDRLYTKSVQKSGYIVPDSAINRQLVQNSRFLDNEGKFSQKMYSTTDQSTITTLRTNIEDALTFSRYADDVLGSDLSLDGNSLYGLKSSSAETDFIAKMAAEKKSFTVAAFSTDNFPKEEAVTYAKENGEKFTSYDLSVITVDAKSDAESILKQIKANELLFEDAVADKSAGYYAETDGKISSPYRYQIANTIKNEEDIEKVTSLAQGELSEVIETNRGYSIFRADGSPKAADLTDEATVSLILSYMKTYESGYVENYYSDIARNFIADAAINGFENACAKFGIEAQQVQAFPLNYGNADFIATNPSDITSLTGLYLNENALEKMFALKVNEISEPFVLSGYVNVAQCTGIQSEETDTSSFASLTLDADDSSARSTMLRSDKLEDDFTNVFFDYMLSSSY